ncbi:hypothetical protein KI387_004887, partial [Taxus chinensis]
MWENLLLNLSASGFGHLIQKVCWFHQLKPIDSLIVEFVRNFRAREGVSSVQGHVVNVKEIDIAKATGLTLEGLELGFWDARMKMLEVSMGIELRYKMWCPDKLASVGIVGKRAFLQFSVGCMDKTRKYLLSLVMQHLSGVNSTTCSVKEYMDSVDGLMAGVNTNWPRHVAQRMALVFARLQKGVSTFVPYASVIAMLLLQQVPGLVQKEEINSRYCVQGKDNTKWVGNSSGAVLNVVETALGVGSNVHLNIAGNACWNEAQRLFQDVKVEVGDQSVCWDEGKAELKDLNFEAGGIEKLKRSECQKQGKGLDLNKPADVLAVQNSGITQRCLRESPSRKLCCSQCPPLKASLKKHRTSGEMLSGGQNGEQSQTSCGQSRREECGAQSECAIQSECRHRAQSVTQKRKSRSITELLIEKRPKLTPSKNCLEERSVKGSKALSCGTKAYNSSAKSLEMEHIQQETEANLDVLGGYRQKGEQWAGQQEPLLRAKAKLEDLESKLSEHLLKVKEYMNLHKHKDNQLKEMEVQFILTKAELNSKVAENNIILKELNETKLDLSQKETARYMFNEKITKVKEELKHLIRERNIQSVETALNARNYHKQQDDQMKGLQAQLIQSKAEIKSVIDEKNMLAEQLQKMKESLDYHKEMAVRLEDLEDQSMLKKHKLDSLSDENKKLSRELKETKDDLNRKEVAWKKSNEKLVISIKSIMENGFSEHATLEQATNLEQKPEYVTFLEGSFNTLKQQIDNLVDKCVNSFVFGETTKQHCDNDHDGICSICMEPWTANGEHQICSLACGHYFGRSCIRKWLETSRVINSRK